MLRSQTIQRKEVKHLKEAGCMFTGTLRTQKDDPAVIISLSFLQTITEFQAPWML